MCGIAGIISSNPQEVTQERLRAMTDRVFHRGPDGEGHWINDDQSVGLGHRRLSIIDLSDHAAQPMHYLGRYTIVFNGEIYNYLELKDDLVRQGYAFRTSSDTEVLMALYDRDKEKCLQWLDGMFAFAIYDDREKTVFCARDRFGEKPFHYSFEEGKRFLFGSEMKQLWAVGIEKRPNHRMLYNYLQFGFFNNPSDPSETFFNGIKRLEPSHCMRVDIRRLSVSINRYWDIDLSRRNEDIGEKEACDGFRELFMTSVKRRLRADVPVGSSLSGGLDSSLVVCAIHQLNEDRRIHQKTFSARFPGFSKDESRFQQLVNERNGMESHCVVPDESSMLKNLDRVISHQEEPFVSASIFAQYEVFRLAKENEVTVLLDGQGADEFLAGYHHYYPYFFLELENKEYKRQWKAYADLYTGVGFNQKFKIRLLRSAPILFEALRKVRVGFDSRQGALASDFYHEYKAERFRSPSQPVGLNGMLKQSLLGGGLQNLLRYSDRNSMAHSVEARMPFLSHELVEFVFSLPTHMKINQGWTKYVMRRAFSDLLPPEICWRKDKIGYEPPQKQWMSSKPLHERIHESKKNLVANGILDPASLNQKIQAGNSLEKGDNSWAALLAGHCLF